MAIDYRTPDEIADDYLTTLKATKPEVNTDQTDSDWWVRSRTVGGVVSGVYADQRLIANDAFPQRARHDALGRWLELYLADTFRAATSSEGLAKVTGTGGSTVPINTQFLYEPNGNLYQSTEVVVLDVSATAALVPIQSISTGQSQNLISEAPLSLSSPPAGIDPTASASGNISDGRDDETDAEATARILARIRTPIAGGTATDYAQWAIEANPSVVASNVIRFPFGFGTVGVVIAAGTTDIDQALDNGEPVVLIPSQALVDEVQTFIETKSPVTDCVTVLAPSGVNIDVLVRVVFVSGDLDAIPAGQTLTQRELVEREVQRAIYKTPPGGRLLGGSGFCLASEIEEVIDIGLSAGPYTFGRLELLLDREVYDLSISGPNFPMLATQIAIPGTITVVTT